MNLNLAAEIARATRKSGIFGLSHRDESLRDGSRWALDNDVRHARYRT
jgi:hypothetical protein